MKKKKGFSLIEMLVVIGMMGLVVTGVGISFYRDRQAKNVKNAVNRLVDLIEIARNNAKVRNSPVGSGNSSFRYIELSIDNSVVKITNDSGYEYLETDLSNNGVVIPDVSDCLLCFAAGKGNLVDSSGGLKTETVRLTLSSGGFTGSIDVDSSGLVEIN